MPDQNIEDILGRALKDLRISVTDRCNFRCTYCMPKEIFGRGYRFLPQEEVLTFEEITRLVSVFISLGAQKIRLTGGEPLMRREVEKLIGMIAELEGDQDLAITTNGSFPLDRILALKAAGLQRMTVSLDALDDATFKKMNDVDFPVANVLEWIDASLEAGFTPLKINMVVKRGVNDKDILPMARRFNRPDTILRLIEFMDVGSTNGWRLDDVVSAKQIIEHIHAEIPLEPVERNYRGEVANRYRYKDTGNELGVISSVTQPFCGNCTRIRLSANGSLYTCLFAAQSHDLKSLLREGASDQDIKDFIVNIWQERADRYSELRSSHTGDLPKVEMSFIGG